MLSHLSIKRSLNPYSILKTIFERSITANSDPKDTKARMKLPLLIMREIDQLLWSIHPPPQALMKSPIPQPLLLS